MAIFFLTMKPRSRRTIKSASNYIASFIDETVIAHDSKKHRSSILHTNLIGRQLHFPKLVVPFEIWANYPSEKMWKLTEMSEGRINSRILREIIVNVPYKLDFGQQNLLINLFAQSLANHYAVAVEWLLLTPPAKADERAYRAHLFMTTRCITLNKNNELEFTSKSKLEWSNKNLLAARLPTTHAQLKMIRKQWAELANNILLINGIDEQIDSRSHRDRRLSILPQIRLSPIDRALEKKGINTNLGNYNRDIERKNAQLAEQEYEFGQRIADSFAATESFIETLRNEIEATECSIKKYYKFTKRTDQTDQFIEKYYQQTAATDRAIEQFM